MKKLAYLFMAFGAFFIIACGGSDSSTSSSSSSEVLEDTEDVIEETIEDVKDAASDIIGGDIDGIDDVDMSNTVVLEGNDQMQFDKHLFLVEAGKEITLTLKNVGKLPIEAMGHDVVVLKEGSDVKDFGTASTKARVKDKTSKAQDLAELSDKYKSQIIAETKMLGPGEEATITFTLDEGVYDYLCSFPAHYSTMKGKIVAR